MGYSICAIREDVHMSTFDQPDFTVQQAAGIKLWAKFSTVLGTS
jgi:hypothetical protein